MTIQPSLRLATFALFALPACASVLAPAPAPPHPVAPAVVAPPISSSASVDVAPPPPTKSPPDDRTARLVRLCSIWGEIRYLDPRVVDGSVDWDAALVGALPKALAAQNDVDAIEALGAMLAALHDPVTRVEHDPPSPPETAPAMRSRTVGGVQIVPVANAGWRGTDATVTRIAKEIEASKLVVLDIRAHDDEGAYGADLVVSQLSWRLVSHEGVGIAQRFAEHRGYKTQSGTSTGGYGSFLTTTLPPRFVPFATTHPSPASSSSRIRRRVYPTSRGPCSARATRPYLFRGRDPRTIWRPRGWSRSAAATARICGMPTWSTRHLAPIACSTPASPTTRRSMPRSARPIKRGRRDRRRNLRSSALPPGAPMPPTSPSRTLRASGASSRFFASGTWIRYFYPYLR